MPLHMLSTKKPRTFLFRASSNMVPRLGIATYGYRQGHEDFQFSYAINQKAPNISVQGFFEYGAQTRNRNLRLPARSRGFSILLCLEPKSPEHFCSGLLRIWCPDSESNQGHEDFQSSALPTELSGRQLNKILSLKTASVSLRVRIKRI